MVLDAKGLFYELLFSNFVTIIFFLRKFRVKKKVVQKWTKMDKMDNSYPFWIKSG